MKLSNSTIVLSLAILLVGCSDGSSSGSSAPGSGGSEEGGTNAPGPVVGGPISGKPKLSPAEKAELKIIFAPLNNFPTAELYLVEANESHKDKAERLKKIAKLSSNGKKLLAEIVATCKLTHPVSNPPKIEPIAGSKYSSEETSSANGNLCPVNVNTKESSEMLVEAATPNFETYKFSSTSQTLMVQEVVSAKWQKTSRLKHFNISASGSSTMDSQVNSATMYSKMSGFMTLDHVDKGLVRGDIKFEILGKGVEGTEVETEVYMENIIRYGTNEVVFQKFTKDKIDTYYLNSEQLTAKEAQDIFGPAITMED